MFDMTEPDVATLMSVADAIAILDATAVTPRTETMTLTEADGRVLAGAVRADRDAPPFDKALMDGFAVRAADAASGGTLRRVGEVAAGGTETRTIGPGECVAIMTGAPVPPGADAVLPVEFTKTTGDVVTVQRAIKAGNAIQPRAAEAKAGDELLPAGARLTPAGIAVCATVGAAKVDVFARPRVGVLNTGDEIVPHTVAPNGAQIRNSNTPMLLALLKRYGVEPIDLGHAADDPATIAAALSSPGLDAILVTGGMSMGNYDYTPRVLKELGYDLAITKLKVKPGKPFVFAKKLESRRLVDAPFIFGLPGNPVSAFVCTARLASRLLLRMGGGAAEPEWIVANLGHDLAANGPREFYQPAIVDAGIVRVPAWNGSADLFRLSVANALLVRPADEAALPAGSRVTLLRLP